MPKSNQNNNQDNKPENTPAKVSSKDTGKTEVKPSVPTDLTGLGRVSEATTASLTANMADFKESLIASINALKEMYTNGRDPELDKKIVDSIIQIEGDACVKEAAQADRIIEKNNTDNWWLVLKLAFLAIILGNGKALKDLGLGKINLSQIKNAALNLLPPKLLAK